MNTDRFTVNLVVAFLGAITIASMVIAGILLTNDKSIPDMFVALASGALGGLTGVLVNTRTDNGVTVENTAANPVPVEGGYTLIELALGFLIFVIAIAVLFRIF